MKKILQFRALYLLVLFFTVGFFLSSLSAQISNPPPPPPGMQGESGNQGPMDGAPLGNGEWILLTFVISYGIHKYKRTRSSSSE